MANPTHDISELRRRMQGAIQLLKQELGGLRTGRASASLLEPVQVEAYGTHMPLNQVATVSVPEPRLISVQVWDKSMVHAVEKAIAASNLGLTPSTEGQVLRLRIPELNEERRKELVKWRTNMPRRHGSRCGTSGATALTCSRGSKRITRSAKTTASARPSKCRKRRTKRSPRSIG